MLKYTVRRLLAAIPVLFGLSIILFAFVHFLPGDPYRSLLGQHATPEACQRLRENLGLDLPLWQQYLNYLDKLIHLDFGASIINSGSVVGLRGSAHLLDYATTKGAIHAFTKSLASNLIDKGIRVNAVAPGPVWTPLNPADQQAEKVAEFGKKSDFKRPAQPEELSPAYVFLAAPACSSYVTGVVLPVDGGLAI